MALYKRRCHPYIRMTHCKESYAPVLAKLALTSLIKLLFGQTQNVGLKEFQTTQVKPNIFGQNTNQVILYINKNNMEVCTT